MQDALEYAVQRYKIDVSDIDSVSIMKLVARLVSERRLEGELTPWFGAFTSFANLASHGSYPTQQELMSPQIRMRVLGTFVLGRQLLREIGYCVSPYTPLPS